MADEKKDERKNLKLSADTRKKLKKLSAELEEPMNEIVDRLATAELEKLEDK